MKKFLKSVLQVGVLLGASVYFGGDLYSLTEDSYVVRDGGKLYSIRKNALTASQRTLIDKGQGRGRVAFSAPMEAIEGVKDAPKETRTKLKERLQ